MALSGLYVLLFKLRDTERPSPGLETLKWDVLWQDSNWSWGIVSRTLFKVLYSYAGLGNVNNVLNEVKDPFRTLKSIGRCESTRPR